MRKKVGIAEIQRNIERKVLPHANRIILSDEMKYHIDPSDEEIKVSGMSMYVDKIHVVIVLDLNPS